MVLSMATLSDLVDTEDQRRTEIIESAEELASEGRFSEIPSMGALYGEDDVFSESEREIYERTYHVIFKTKLEDTIGPTNDRDGTVSDDIPQSMFDDIDTMFDPEVTNDKRMEAYERVTMAYLKYEHGYGNPQLMDFYVPTSSLETGEMPAWWEQLEEDFGKDGPGMTWKDTEKLNNFIKENYRPPGNGEPGGIVLSGDFYEVTPLPPCTLR